MVHDSHRLLTALDAFIRERVTPNRHAYEVSDVKSDGTVFIKFRSAGDMSADGHATVFTQALSTKAYLFTRPTAVQFRLALDQFRQ